MLLLRGYIAPNEHRLPEELPPHVQAIQERLLQVAHYDLTTLVSVLPRNHLLEDRALEFFFRDGTSLYIDFHSKEDRKTFFEVLRGFVTPPLQK